MSSRVFRERPHDRHDGAAPITLPLEDFRSEEVAHGLAATDELGLGAVDEDFCGAGAGVVVGGEGHAVGSGVEEQDEIAGFYGAEDAVAGEEIARLAYRAYDVDGDG